MEVSEEQLKDLLQQTGEAWLIANMLGKEERWEEARQQPQDMKIYSVNAAFGDPEAAERGSVVVLLCLGTSKWLFAPVLGRFYRCQFFDLTAIAPGVL